MTLKTPKREFKDARYSGFAEVGKIFSSAKRLEIIDTLIQRPHSVEEIASSIEQSIASTSQHLQVLKRAQAVTTQRQGTTIIYDLAEGTREIYIAMRKFAEDVSPYLQLLRQQHAQLPTVTFEDVQISLQDNTALLIDVRTSEEFASGHIEGAVNIPLADLPLHLSNLPSKPLLIVTCRGPYCVSSEEAVRLLLAHGFEVARYDDGVGEWSAQGGIISTES